MFKKIEHKIATLGFIGFLPYAPGTFGTAVSFLFVLLLRPGEFFLLPVIIAMFVLGTYVSTSTEKLLGKDSGHIVIDELCGYIVSVLFVPKTIGYLVAAFILFRIFDIVKPPPIRRIEKEVPGGLGIMLDDLAAGIYANICLHIWMRLN